ncbi:toxin-activating lysine-acyltransferase [Pseudaestuariivita atlantica]|uniref:toxin-activating lysine-acyltransferase n=1 Tax=Pseudaestuariivita atlantica TaxID=1317121 RepID=UPI00067CFD15|nr:toxin-activating lysine-acyltransferase [Pseudaestuariivita atlantica]
MQRKTKVITVKQNDPTAEQIALYGAFAFLYMRSSSHSGVPIGAARLGLQPPVLLGYCRIFHDQNGVPRAGLTWAMLSDEVEEKFLRGEPLTMGDWTSGSNFWVMEIIAPFGRPGGAQVMNWLRMEMPKHVTRVRYVRQGMNGKPHRVIECNLLENGRAGARVIKTFTLETGGKDGAVS